MKKAGAEQIKRITLKGIKISREGLEKIFLAGAQPPLPPLEKGCTLDL
jgi:hypothetical protein